jgi:LPS sulfotransferase NodH
MPPGERDKALRLICDRRLLIKHCYENLSEDFNHALAEISTRAGYRHIHLFRRDEIARLISKGLAEQHGTWGASEFTRARHAAWLATGEKLPPLDVAALKQYHDLCESRWMAVSGLLRAHDVEFEQLTREPGRVLDRLAVYLRLPSAFVPGMCRKLGRGQDSRDVWRLIPNTNKLQAAIYPGEPVRRSAAFYWSVK